MHEEILKEWQRLLKAGRRSFKQHTLEVFLLVAHVCDCCGDGARIVVICYWLSLSLFLYHVERTALRRGSWSRIRSEQSRLRQATVRQAVQSLRHTQPESRQMKLQCT